MELIFITEKAEIPGNVAEYLSTVKSNSQHLKCKYGQCFIVTIAVPDDHASVEAKANSTMMEALDSSFHYIASYVKAKNCDVVAFSQQFTNGYPERLNYYAKCAVSFITKLPMFLVNDKTLSIDVIKPGHAWANDPKRTWVRSKLLAGGHRSGYLENMLQKAPNT